MSSSLALHEIKTPNDRSNSKKKPKKTQTILELTSKQCVVDSGGYTMKWRSVKPNPWAVRRRSTVLGLGQENSSSVSYGPVGEPAKLPHSGDSFCTEGKKVWGSENIPAFIFTLSSPSVKQICVLCGEMP